MTTDEKFMLRAMELAELGRGQVRPNPLVGCVVVHEERIIGEGYHKKYGGAHAEVNALNAVENQDLLRDATVFVTLEPCAHHGKTPPCADLLVRKGVKKVVISAVDSNPLVGGKGIKILQDAGIEVQWGVLEKVSRRQNDRFFTFMEKKRPFVLLKWAQTSDGFVARSNYDSKWISNAYSRQLVHKWRTEEQAIMVGTKTAHFDNPRLNVRDYEGENPVRVVIDKQLTLDPNSHLLDGSQPTICYNQLKNESLENLTFVQMEEEFSVSDILDDLYQKNIQSILVEGGSYLLQRFISENLWDEARVFIGNIKFESGIPAPLLHRSPGQSEDVMGDRLDIYFNHS